MSTVDPAGGAQLWGLLGAVLVGLWTGGILALTRFPKTPLSRTFRGFGLCAALWALGDLIAGHAPDLLWKQIGITIHYSGAIFLPSLWWILALRWAEERGAAPPLDARRWTRIPLGFAAAMWLVMVTNPWHGRFLVPVLGWRNLYGPLWWVMAVPNYGLILGSFAVAIGVLRRSRLPGVRRQGALMIAASGLTLVAHWVYVAGIGTGANATIPVLAVAAMILAVGMLRDGLFGVLPAALSVIASDNPDGLVVVRRDGRVIYANARARVALAPARLDKESPLPSALSSRLLRPDGVPVGAPTGVTTEEGWWRTVLESPDALYRYGADDVRWLRISARPVQGLAGRLLAHCLRIRDVTDEQRAEIELRRARRLESVAELALGVAHDFHNLLTVVRANAELLVDHLPAKPELQRKLSKILRSSQQATELADHLQLYAGAAEPVRATLDLSALARDMLEMLDAEVSAARLEKRIHLELRFAAQPLIVEADATQLRQLVLNLFVNARDALGENGGEIQISTGRSWLDPARAAHVVLGRDRPAAVYCYLKVSDTGGGMEPETQERIFEPFFSTKGKHRGIGLSTVLGIARSHDAVLELRSQVGRGTAFTLYFPIAEGDGEGQAPSLAGTRTSWNA
ncbi:MAG TPA: histidine kinase N-terminal 7TM domain-containing protein [Myxococcota bacterium]|nr:histidine kinase N-terminal 7TM domain-containing protein [Myxococcota bacterium]